MKSRIIGIDVARGLAVIGMIIVNFKIAFGSQGNETLNFLTGLLEGKAAATFVVLAGVGIGLSTKRALKEKNHERMKSLRKGLFRRALFLFFIGTIYLPIWPADILHFYGIYMLLVLLLITKEDRAILIAAVLIILSYPILMTIWEYDLGWDFTSFHYDDLWSPVGFLRNLFYNGFHPVIPWSAFMLIGVWFGRKDLRDSALVWRSFWISLGVFISALVLSEIIIYGLSTENQNAEELRLILGTSPMPPLPIYMISGSSIAIFVISGSVLIASKYPSISIIKALMKMGQLALTFYVAHVIIGMGIVETVSSASMGKLPIAFSFSYALIFCLVCIVFAYFWLRKYSFGPLEWLMKLILDRKSSRQRVSKH